MSDTSASLMEKLRNPSDEVAWRRFRQLYEPLLRYWLGAIPQQPLQPTDVDDLLQEVFLVLMTEMPTYNYDRRRTGPFRAWLRQIVVNRLRAFWRKRRPQADGGSDFLARLNQYEDPHSEASCRCDREHDAMVLERAKELVRQKSDSSDWQVFQRVVLDEVPVATVAAEFGITESAVYCAKSRVKRQLRELLQYLID